ncbi:MAG: PH domain-containing protein [Methanobrevibacter sp.]|nr:PH domain-containing protein [Methanobrevibacter sp.]
MLFNNNDSMANDRVIYKTKPNMLLGCKKAIFGIVLLIVILSVSPVIIRFMGNLQVYLISHINLPLTRYVAIAFFVVILINVVYIIWQLIGWYSREYILTDTKIIIKSGVISTKKNYMPYATIQDINTSQSIFARLFNVGSVSVFSAYDNNQMELKDISNPSEVEEIIFSRMTGPRNFQAPPQSMPHYQERMYEDNYGLEDEYVNHDDYLGRNDYYDEYEPITPITHERNSPQRAEYDYYPEDRVSVKNNPRHTYEYEPYSGFDNPRNNPPRENNYNQRTDDYSYRSDDYYQNNEPQDYYEEVVEKHPQNSQEDMDGLSEDVIQRHFDKFKK